MYKKNKYIHLLLTMLFVSTFCYSQLVEKKSNVVIINIGNLNRKEIFKLVEIVNKNKPNLICINTFFSEKKEIDTFSINTLKKVSKLITPYKLDSDSNGKIVLQKSFFNIGEFGLGNFIEDKNTGIVSSYILEIGEIKSQKKSIKGNLSLVGQIILSYDSTFFYLIKDLKKPRQIKIYANDLIYSKINGIDLLNESNSNKYEFENKIVIFGYMGNDCNKIDYTKFPEDVKFISPNEKIYSIELIANCVIDILSSTAK